MYIYLKYNLFFSWSISVPWHELAWVDVTLSL